MDECVFLGMMVMRPALFGFLVLLAGCASFPDVDAAQAGRVVGPTLGLVPMADLLAQDRPGRATPAARDALDARAQGLRVRAGAMRGPVQDAATRARLAAAIAAYPALIAR